MAGDVTAARLQNSVSGDLFCFYYFSARISFLHRLETLCTEVSIAGSRKYHSKCVLQPSLGAEMVREHYQRLVLQPFLCTEKCTVN